MQEFEVPHIIDALRQQGYIITTAGALRDYVANEIERRTSKVVTRKQAMTILGCSSTSFQRHENHPQTALRRVEDGSKGRGKQTRYLRRSVELEKERLNGQN